MEFTLAHGTANDFVVLPDLDDRHPLSGELARALCDRHRGLGGDGVLRIAPGRDVGSVFMDHRNADGSIAEMCGNGVRVLAKYVVDRGLVPVSGSGEVRIETRAGLRRVTVELGPGGRVDQVSVDMGTPVFEPDRVPFDTSDPSAVVHEVQVDGEAVELSVVSMGNPHGVVVVDDVATAAVSRLGPRLEVHPRFPARANIGFAQVVDDARIRLRVWERGVGETAACGTGACAAVVVLQRRGLVGGHVAVELPGGVLTIDHDTERVRMTGPAVEVASGALDADWLAEIGAGTGVT